MRRVLAWLVDKLPRPEEDVVEEMLGKFICLTLLNAELIALHDCICIELIIHSMKTNFCICIVGIICGWLMENNNNQKKGSNVALNRRILDSLSAWSSVQWDPFVHSGMFVCYILCVCIVIGLCWYCCCIVLWL